MPQQRRASALCAIVCVAGLALACASNGVRAVNAPTESPGTGAGLGVGSVLASALYAPVKIVYAAGGAIVGSFAWILTGGNTDAAMSIYRPSMTGDYVLTAEHLRDPGSIAFIGGSHSPATADIAAVSAAPPSGVQLCTGRSSVHFATGSATLDAAAQRELEGVARELQRCPEQPVRILGYADGTGESGRNRDLSRQRAVAVERYLVARGVGRARLSASGLGTSNPVSSNTTAKGRAENRRAEIALQSR
jgi:hypothetical protein